MNDYNEYKIRYIALPYTIKGVTVMDNGGYYNIYINSRLSWEDQKKAVRHELEHIQRDDFDNTFASLEEVEAM